MRFGLPLILSLVLSACVLPGGETAGPPAGGIVGDAVTTTTLAPAGTLPAGEAADAVVEVVEVVEVEAPADAAPPVEAEPAPEEDVTAEPEPAAASETEADAAPTEPQESEAAESVVQESEAPKSEAQIACERRGGSWARVIPGTELRSCVRRTRDAGKRCDSGRDCAGECLARSASCAPVDPLFGCNEILDDTGRRMTLCIE